MAETVRVVVDAMGGDNAPAEPVKAAVEAVAEREDIDVILTGRQDVIEKELSKFQNYPKERIQIVNTTEVIETAEPPVLAIRKKKDSSIVVGLNLVKKQEAEAFVSSGSSGAILVGGQVIVGRSKGVQRPPRCERRCQTRASGTVCEDGFHLYGRRGWNQEPSCCHCKHWCRGGEGKCPCERDVPSFEGMPGDQFYWKY